MDASKPKACHQATWARFQVTSVLLFFTGLRAVEVACVNREIIEDIFENGTLTAYQSKVNKFRKIRFTSHGIKALKYIFDKTKNIIFTDNSVLYNIENTKSEKAKKFTRSINKYLNLVNTDKDLNLSSHSFRVGFVTNSLKHTTLHKAQVLIGHADVRSTMKYSRYLLEREEEDDILNQMFE